MHNPWLPKATSAVDRGGRRRLSLVCRVVLFAMMVLALVGRPIVATGTPAAKTSAAPVATPKPAATPPSTPATTDQIPDYGGRDLLGTSAPTGGDTPASPLSQAWRAFEALVIVLAVTMGVLYVIKRYGLIKEGSFPAAAQRSGLTGMLMTGWQNFVPAGRRPTVPADPAAGLAVLSSTTLPGPTPASVHVLEVAGRRYLVGATGGGMTLLADWEADPAADGTEPELPNEEERFEKYLNQMGVTSQTPPEVVGERVSQTTDRLQALLARNREGAEE